MALATATLNAAADGAVATITHVSLHTGDPSTTGANEVTGGTPPYARQAVTFDAAVGGATASSATLTFDIPAGTTVSHWGTWASATWRGGGTVSSSETFAGQGTYGLSTLTITAQNPA